MKIRVNNLFRIMGFIAVVICCTNVVNGEKIKEYTGSGKIQLLDKEFKVISKLSKNEMFVINKNQNYIGKIKVNDKDKSLTFHLLNKNGTEVWREKATSEWIIVFGTSQENGRVVMFGKKIEEGYISLEESYFEGIAIYSLDGKFIKKIENTGFIDSAELLDEDEGLLVFSNPSGKGFLRCVDKNGNELWKIKAPDKFRILDNFIVTEDYLKDTNEREIKLYNKGGGHIKDFKDKSSSYVRIVGVSKNGKHICIANKSDSNKWKIVLYRDDEFLFPSEEFFISDIPIGGVISDFGDKLYIVTKNVNRTNLTAYSGSGKEIGSYELCQEEQPACDKIEVKSEESDRIKVIVGKYSYKFKIE